MRLLNTTTLNLETFPNFDTPIVPAYAILSHRWGRREVTFQEMQNPSLEVGTSAGYLKIKGFCEKAATVGFEYAWVDTCCIDKTNLVELTEAINSMFDWYRDSAVCYAYLGDVSSEENPHDKDSQFRKSVWFTRGWTLQELLAPTHVEFYAEDWKAIGTKRSLTNVIADITGIQGSVTHNPKIGSWHCDHEEVTIAQRMSWAAHRQTEKVEDKAYCLMGIFGRVPQMKTGKPDVRRGLLAESPDAFANSTTVVQTDTNGEVSHYSMTNKGIHIRLPMVPLEELGEPYTSFERNWVWPDCGGDQTCLVMLQCRNGSARIGLYLRRAAGANTWNRVRAHEFGQLPNGASTSPLLQHGTEMYIQDPKSNSFWKFWSSCYYDPRCNHIFVFKNRGGLAPGREAVHKTNENQDIVKWELDGDNMEVKVINRDCWALMNFITSTGGSVSVRLGFPSYDPSSPWCSIHDTGTAPGFEHMPHVVDGLGSAGDASSTSIDEKCWKLKRA